MKCPSNFLLGLFTTIAPFLMLSCNSTTTTTSSSGSANALSFSVQPSASAVGSPISSAIVVKVVDSNNNLVSTATPTITISLSSNPASASLSGTLSQTAVGGIATFSNISLSKLGSAYKISAASPGLSSATSSAFDILNISIGSIGALTATSGTCPSSGVAAGWCTGGTFTSGTVDGSFGASRAVIVDGVNSFVYAANGNKIDKINLNTGAYVGSIGNTTASTGTCPVGVATTWCTGGTFTSGSTDGAFNIVRSMAVDVTNNALYIVDNTNFRIVKVNLATGAFIGAIGKTSGSTGTCPVGVATTWCTGGTFVAAAVDGSFNNPTGIAVDSILGKLYVSERNNSRVSKFNLSTGAFIGAIGNLSATAGTCPATGAASTWCTGGTFASGAGDGMFAFAWAVAVDPLNDLLYVGDGNNRVTKHTLSTGAFIGAVGSASASTGSCSVGINTSWCTGGTFAAGAVDGAFSTIQAIAIDVTTKSLYVGDQANNRVIKMSTNGSFVGAIGSLSASSGTCPATGAALTWCTGGTFAAGTGDGMMTSTYGMAIDPINNSMIVGDPGGPRFSKFFK